MTPEQLPSILAEFGITDQDIDYLVVSRTEPPLPLKQSFPEGSSVEWLCHVHSAEDVVAVKRAHLSIVFDQLEHMEKENGVHLLARLRDQYSDRVLLHCTDQIHSDQELMALGFIKQKRPSSGGRFFLFDPENFKKY